MQTRSIAVLLPCIIALSGCAQAQSAPQSNFALTAATVAAFQAGGDGSQPHPAMLRFPDVSQDRIVFVYADDLWVVSRDGGTASPLASPPGQEATPKFSADGQSIAFAGNYDGNRDLYTISVDGGVPFRVTHHPAGETLCDWTADHGLLFFSNGFAGLRRQTELMTVSATGGIPRKLPPPYGANGAISPDGQWLAYTPHTRDARTWKRYRGGMATDIWLMNLKTHESRKITDWEGTDSLPMWHGQTVYYLSDAGPEHRLNIWSYDTTTKQRTQHTRFADFDVKWPSMGPGPNGGGEIVFQNGANLYLHDLQAGNSRAVSVTLPGDRPTIRPRDVDASKYIQNWDVSSTGKRVVLEARGDIWTIPAKHGSPRNLTRSDDVAERDPSWSPDGQWIAYFSDKTGEYELYVTQSDGKGETKQLTSNGLLYRYSPTWSPDSRMIAFSDKSGGMHLHTIESGETKTFDTEPTSGRSRFSWSSDSQWIAYTKTGENNLPAVWFYNAANDQTHRVTAGMFADTWPTFDRKGDYLFLASNRDFTSPTYEDIGQSFVYADTDTLLIIPLRDEVGSPWAAKSDEEKWNDSEEEEENEDSEAEDDAGDAQKEGDAAAEDGGDSKDEQPDSAEGKKNGDDKDKGKDEKKPDPVEIELDGFERRALKLPIKRGAFGGLSFSGDGKLIYTRAARRGSGGDPAIQIFDLEDEKKKEKAVAQGVGSFIVTADGKKLLIRKGRKAYLVDAKADQKLDKPISTKGMSATIDPRAEWRQIFLDAWRIQRDFFYDPNMHGVDWNAMRERYGAMLNDCVSRRDVAFVIGEMISELNVGHAYVRGLGDVENAPRVSVGMLGASFELANGAFRIAGIYEGAPWDVDARGPLSEPGVDIKVGDYLLSVNGVPLDTSKDPWASFQGMANTVVTLQVSENPVVDDKARDVVVQTRSSDSVLRYRAWIEAKRKYVEEKTDGRVGYVYVPDTGVNGQNNLIRQFYGQTDKEALIIDERWNGGGQIPTRFIEMLNRPATNYWAVRHGRDWTWPPDSHQGPKCMLINGLAGSGGDCFPYYFRRTGLGKLIGMRTWGGLVGISGNPTLIDNGRLSAPTFAFYETDGTWGVEGHGVDPDIEVVDDPALMVDGGDPQLDAAIEHMLSELKRNPYKRPERPRYPDRSGMGIREEDK